MAASGRPLRVSASRKARAPRSQDEEGLTRARSALRAPAMSAAAPAPAPAEAPQTAAAASSAPAAAPASASAPAAAPLVAAGGASDLDLDGDENEVPGLISAGESDYFSDDGLWLHGWHIAGAPGAGLVIDGQNGLNAWPAGQLPWHVGGMAHLGGLHGGNLVRLLFGGGCLFCLFGGFGAGGAHACGARAVRGPAGRGHAATQPPRRGRRGLNALARGLCGARRLRCCPLIHLSENTQGCQRTLTLCPCVSLAIAAGQARHDALTSAPAYFWPRSSSPLRWRLAPRWRRGACPPRWRARGPQHASSPAHRRRSCHSLPGSWRSAAAPTSGTSSPPRRPQNAARSCASHHALLTRFSRP